MDLTIGRWFAGIAAACALAAAILLPFPPAHPESWRTTQPPALVAAMDRVIATRGTLSAAVRDYRTAQALARWRAASARADTTFQRVDASVPGNMVAALRQVASEHWARLGPGASAAHAEVFVYVDTSSIPRLDPPPSKRRSLEVHRAFDLWYGLPAVTDGSRCVALVRLRSTSPEAIAELRRAPLFGPCGFYAAFGEPGAGIRAWLAATGYGGAWRADWDVPRAPALDASGRYGLPTVAGACLTGADHDCMVALGVASADDSRAAVARPASSMDGSRGDDDLIGAGIPSRPLALGNEEGRILADLARDVGRSSFARLWHSAAPLPSAFANATGGDFSAWVRGWLARTYGAPAKRPTLGVREVVWLALGMPLMLAAAFRRREHVLSERWLGLGAPR